MDHLRRLFENLDFQNVETFIASGNVIFESSSKNPKLLEKKIESHLLKALGYDVVTFVRSMRQLGAISMFRPFPDDEVEEAHALYIGFFRDTPQKHVLNGLAAYISEANDFHLSKREVYWLSRRKMSESEFSPALLEETLEMPVTLRNSNTIKRLAAKYCVIDPAG